MIRLRIGVLVLLLGLGFCAVLGRAFQLQILPHEKLERLARRQLQQRVEIVGRRGPVTDRNGRELAVSVNSVSIFANPKLVVKPRKVAAALAPVLGVPESQIMQRLRDAGERRFLWLHRQLDHKQMTALEKLDLKELKGVGVLPEFRREFPQGALASHILGFVSIDGQGLEGLEHRYDNKLKGERESLALGRDNLGRPLFTQSDQIRMDLTEAPTLELTIDAKLQFSVERALREAVETTGAESATAIVMDPRTGEIYAMGSAPTFDPNNPGAAHPAHRRNLAVTDSIEPGSVVKPFVVAKAIEDHIVGPETRISAGDGFIKIGRKTIGEAEAKHRFNSISIVDLIRFSSNVGTVVLQQKMGWPRVDQVFRAVGFGRTTGIELDGEVRGIFNSPKPEQKLEQATMSFGQGIAVTPLQIATAYSIIANGGVRVRPTLVRRVGEVIVAPTEVGERVFSEATSYKMRQILEKVVENEGTGVQARIEGFKVAGKTGTAQRADGKRRGYEAGAYLSSFAGFIPSENPRFVVYVLVDKPTKGSYFGGTVAAPVFAKIALAAVRFIPGMRAPPVAEAAPPSLARRLPAATLAKTKNLAKPKKVALAKPTPSPDAVAVPVTIAGGARLVPDVKGLPLSQALGVLKKFGFKMNIEGEGSRVVDQIPAAGSTVTGTDPVRIQLR